MPNWLTLNWENDRLTLLSARIQNGTAVFEQAYAVSLKPEGNGESSHSVNPANLAGSSNSDQILKKKVAEFVQQHRLAKSETVVVVGRGDVEVRPMLFPPVPVDELPDLVRFQASKEFNGYDPSSPLDFVITNKLENVSRSTLFPALRTKGKGKVDPPPPTIGGPKHVLASTVRKESFVKIQKLCEDLNLNLRRVVLRPCEVAFLWRQSAEFDLAKTYLFVELDAVETPQSVLHAGRPIFMRSPKIGLHGDVSSPDFAAKLLAELKRTRIAVRNEVQGVTIDEVVLCGTGNPFLTLAERIADGLGVPTVMFDPWKDVRRDGELKLRLPEFPERFAPLIGATIQAGKSESSDIDFCNPKKRPEPAGKRELFTGIIAAALLLLAVFVVYGLVSRSVMTEEIKTLSNKLNTLKKSAAVVTDQKNQLAAIDAWLADDVNWFEQLDWLSRKAPGSQEMILNDLIISANNGGSMSLKTLVKDSSVISPMEENLRDDKHAVRTAEKAEVKGSGRYGFRFNLSVFLSKASAAAAAALEQSLPEPSPLEPSQTETPVEDKTPSKAESVTEKERLPSVPPELKPQADKEVKP